MKILFLFLILVSYCSPAPQRQPTKFPSLQQGAGAADQAEETEKTVPAKIEISPKTLDTFQYGDVAKGRSPAVNAQLTDRYNQLGTELVQALDHFEQSYAECTTNGIDEPPYLAPEDIEKLRSLGPEGIAKILLNTAAGDDAKDESEESGYNDQFNWAFLNVIAGASAIAGGLAISAEKSVVFKNPEINAEFDDWKVKNPGGSVDSFIAASKKVDIDGVDSPRIRADADFDFNIKASRSVDLSKKVAIGGGIATIIAGGFMAAASQGWLGLTDQFRCPANNYIREEVSRIQREFSNVQKSL